MTADDGPAFTQSIGREGAVRWLAFWHESVIAVDFDGTLGHLHWAAKLEPVDDSGSLYLIEGDGVYEIVPPDSRVTAAYDKPPEGGATYHEAEALEIVRPDGERWRLRRS